MVNANGRNLIWVYPRSLDKELDSATWLETARHLQDLGWQVTLVHPGAEDLRSIAGVPVVSLPMPDVYMVRQAVFHSYVLREIARRWHETDVILFHQMSGPWLMPLRYIRTAAGRQKPLVIMDTRTAPMMPDDVASLRDKARILYTETMNKAANHLTDGQTAISVRMANMMHIPESQLDGIWPSGVNQERFAPAQQKRDWSTIDEEVRIIYVGALFPGRNLMNFCRAVERANGLGMNFHFDIIGDGPERQDLLGFAASTNSAICVCPPVPHAQVPDYLAQAHIGVLPFPDQERFRVSSPIKLFEYMASGLPILATHIVCHTDVVGDGRFAFWAYEESVQGLLVALVDLWERRLELPTMGEQAAEAAHEWTWAASAAKLDQALRSRLHLAAAGKSVSR